VDVLLSPAISSLHQYAARRGAGLDQGIAQLQTRVMVLPIEAASSSGSTWSDNMDLVFMRAATISHSLSNLDRAHLRWGVRPFDGGAVLLWG